MTAERVRVPWVALVGYVPSFGVDMCCILAPVITYVTIHCRPPVFLVIFSYVGRNARWPPDKHGRGMRAKAVLLYRALGSTS